MLGALQDKLVTLVLPLVLAPLVMLATQQTKRYVAWLDRQHAIVKQVLSAAYTLGFTALAAAVGAKVCQDGSATCDIAQLDWRVILTWAFATAMHGWRAKKD